ncbi:MAG: hypothetical protein OEZ28_03750 [Nitrospinota bacterium]|nr:hypothetical protein [Nitrospinota bacterium]
MINSAEASIGPYRLAVEKGLPGIHSGKILDGEFSGALKISILEVSDTPVSNLMEMATKSGAHLLAYTAPAGRAGIIVRKVLLYSGALEKRRRENALRAFEPQAFYLSGENLDDKLSDLVNFLARLEAGEFSEALKIRTQWPDAPFNWLAGMAHFWKGTPRSAFKEFQRIPYVEDGLPEEEVLFKSGLVNGAVSLLETALTETTSPLAAALLKGSMDHEAPDLAARALDLLEKMNQSVDPLNEPELAGVICYNLGRAALAGKNGLALAIEEFRKAINISPQVSVYAEGVCAYTLAGALRDSATDGSLKNPERLERLAEAEQLASHALLVYSKDSHASRWAATQNLLGSIFADAAELAPQGQRTQKLVRAVEAFSLAIEEMDEAQPEWAAAMMGLCGGLVSLGAAMGNKRGLGFVEEALSLLDEMEPKFALIPDSGLSENAQLGRAGAMMVKRQIENSISA